MPMIAADSRASRIPVSSQPRWRSSASAYAVSGALASDAASARVVSIASSRSSAPSSVSFRKFSVRSLTIVVRIPSGGASTACTVVLIPPSLQDSGDQGLLSLFPVAGAQLVGLQRIERAQHFLDVAADVQVVDGNPADD